MSGNEPPSRTPTAADAPNEARGRGRGVSPIDRLLAGFIARVDSLAETLPLASGAIAAATNDVNDSLGRFVLQHGKEVAGKPNEVLIPGEHYAAITRLQAQIEKANIASVSIPRSFVVALVSEYDAFLSGLIRILFELKPAALNASEKSFSYTDIAEFETIAALREHVVEKQIESVLRDSHAEQFKWLENKFGLVLRKGLPSWPAFIEITERRNLFVHNNGVVTKQYLDTCKEHGWNCGETKRGDTLLVDDLYFKHAHETIFEIAVKLAHVLWRKVDPNDRETADGNLAGHVIYELIFQERYSLAATMADFGSDTFKKFASEYQSRVLTINRAQAHKWLGDGRKCKEILDAEDWTASNDEFRLCVEALRENHDAVATLMRRISRAERPGPSGYREWPIFKEAKKQLSFQQAFQDIFGEPINIVTAPSKSDAPAAQATE